jgi:hypothetical protein
MRTGVAMKAGLLAMLLAGALMQPAWAGKAINSVNSMPNRLSMNVTTARQTQGKTFGESVSAGLQQGASALAQRASSLRIECGVETCDIVMPDGVGFRADLSRLSLTSVPTPAPDGAQRNGALTQGASLLGGALGGNFAGVVSAAASSVGGMAKQGGAVSSSYAAGRRAAPVPVDLNQPLEDGEYLLTVVVQKAASGDKSSRTKASEPQRVQIEVAFDVAEGVFKTSHDTAKNSVSNVR